MPSRNRFDERRTCGVGLGLDPPLLRLALRIGEGRIPFDPVTVWNGGAADVVVDVLPRRTKSRANADPVIPTERLAAPMLTARSAAGTISASKSSSLQAVRGRCVIVFLCETNPPYLRKSIGLLSRPRFANGERSLVTGRRRWRRRVRGNRRRKRFALPQLSADLRSTDVIDIPEPVRPLEARHVVPNLAPLR